MVESGTVCIDVDGTLLYDDGTPNPNIVAWAREQYAKGQDLIIWSAKGKQHAQQAMHRAHLEDMAIALAKPLLNLDDKGWSWVRYTRCIHPRMIKQITSATHEQE